MMNFRAPPDRPWYRERVLRLGMHSSTSCPPFPLYLAVATTFFLMSAPAAAQSPGVTVSTTSLGFPEGETRTYTVVLDTPPSGDVTITVTASDDPSRCEAAHGPSCTRKSVATVDKPSLTFTTSDWNEAQTVTVTAVDEDMAGIFKFARIAHQASGGGYDGVSIRGSPSLSLMTTRGMFGTTTRRGTDSLGTSTGNVAFWEHQGRLLPESMRFYVSLNSEPTATATVMLESPDTDLVKLTGGTTLTFSTSDWNMPQPVDVEVIDDQIDEGGLIRAHRLLLDVTVAGTGSDYDGFVPNDFFVDVWNNDRPVWSSRRPRWG